MHALKLTQIWIYPVKSLGGISLSSAKVMGKGLEHDRRWMLVDASRNAMTQRIYPQMALFKLSVEDSQLNIKYEHHALKIPLKNYALLNRMEVTIWDDTISAFEVSTDYSDWFSELLKTKCKLVNFLEEDARPVDPKYKVNEEHVSLADAYPFLIVGQSSLDDLNSRLKEPVPINRFRPNFVYAGGAPYEEDTWKNFTIGSTRFIGVKPCARCAVTTVNQDTAEKGVEPLKTLSTYRKRDNKIHFGQNLVALDHENVVVGDLITIK